MQRPINFQAMGIGSCINIGGTFFCAFLINNAAIHYLVSRGVPLSELGNAPGASTRLVVTLFGVAVRLAMLAGYAAARIAGRDVLVYSFVSGVPVLLINIVGLFSPVPSYQPLWYYGLSLLLCIPLALLGAYIAKRKAT